MKYVLIIVLFSVFFTGCSIKQEVKSIKNLDSKEVCIVKNDKVRDTFLETYRSTLEGKNYKVIIKERNSDDLQTCFVKSTYVANWRWDLAMYMAYAKISVFQNDKLIGEALYDSLSGGANMGKFINADNKIRELIEELYP